MVHEAYSVSSRQGNDAAESVSPSVLYSQELHTKIKKCRSMAFQSKNRSMVFQSRRQLPGGCVEYQYNVTDDMVNVREEEDAQVRDDSVASERKRQQVTKKNGVRKIESKPIVDDDEAEKRAVQKKIDELLRDPAGDGIIANPRLSASGNLEVAKMQYKKNIDYYMPEEDSSCGDSYTASTGGDFLDQTDWITRADSNDAWSFLCCVPGEFQAGEWRER